MKELVENLYKFNRCLLGAGFDNALEYLNHLIPLEILEFPSGAEYGTWTVPNEWIVKDAWIKDPEGNKIADYQTNPLSLVVGSTPQRGSVTLEELRKHWIYSDEMPDHTPYGYSFYYKDKDRNWGFCFPKNQVKETNDGELPPMKLEDGTEFSPGFKDKLKEGEYEVFIDTEYRPGKLKVGVHTIKGKSDREILLFAHLDHPYQANDNLSGVACLVDLAMRLKCDHTIKIVFCPETIGSVAYALTQDLSKVDFMIAVDAIGNNNTLLLQNAFDKNHKINKIAHLATQQEGKSFRKGQFRNDRGSDEYIFNDPLIGVPGIMFTRHPYKEYHTSADTPEIIDYEKITEVQNIITRIIEYWEKDFIPKREFRGQLMRHKFDIQSPNPQFNLSWDYLIYNMNGERSVAELCTDFGLNFEFTYETLDKMSKDGTISKVGGSNVGKSKQQKTTRKKHKAV